MIICTIVKQYTMLSLVHSTASTVINGSEYRLLAVGMTQLQFLGSAGVPVIYIHTHF